MIATQNRLAVHISRLGPRFGLYPNTDKVRKHNPSPRLSPLGPWNIKISRLCASVLLLINMETQKTRVKFGYLFNTLQAMQDLNDR